MVSAPFGIVLHGNLLIASCVVLWRGAQRIYVLRVTLFVFPQFTSNFKMMLTTGSGVFMDLNLGCEPRVARQLGLVLARQI